MTETPRQKATAFHIGLADGAAHSKKAKPKQSGPFKFLRKDEGNRVDTQRSSDDSRENRRFSNGNSRSELRQAISQDIRNVGHRDHFAESEVAVPKRPPRKQFVGEDNPEKDDRSTSPQKVEHELRAKPRNETPRHTDPDTSIMDDQSDGELERGPDRTRRAPASRNELLRTVHPTKTRTAPESEDDEEEEEQQVRTAKPRRTLVANYFRRERQPAPVEEDESENILISQLQKEVDDCKKERQRYRQLSAELVRDRQRLEQMKDEVEEQLQLDRDEFEAYCLEEKKQIRKDRRQLEEQKRTLLVAGDGEKEELKALRKENDRLHSSIEKLTSEAKDRQKALRMENESLQHQIQDLTAKNAELREALRREQLKRLEAKVAKESD